MPVKQENIAGKGCEVGSVPPRAEQGGESAPIADGKEKTGTEDKKILGISVRRITKVLTGSFIVIMAIHIVVFTAIGLFTPAGWRLLWIFLFGLAVMLLVVLPVKYIRKKRKATRERS